MWRVTVAKNGEFEELRRLADETLQSAAARIGISSTKLWNFEQGISNATLTRHQLSTLLGVYAEKIEERGLSARKVLSELRALTELPPELSEATTCGNGEGVGSN